MIKRRPACAPVAFAQYDYMVLNLPRFSAPVRVSPFLEGTEGLHRCLVEIGPRFFVVSSLTGVLVEGLAQSSDSSDIREFMFKRTGRQVSEDELAGAIKRLPKALFDSADSARASEVLTWRVSLLNEKFVGWLADRLHHAFDRRVVCVALMLTSFMVLLGGSVGMDQVVDLHARPIKSLVLLFALVGAAFAHELGHAAACRRFGVSPGAIGFGFYVFFPVLYADVTCAWRLSPSQRATVDIGGMYFQLLGLLAVSPWLFSEGFSGEIGIFYFYNISAIVHNLNPFFKLDGYWLLSDISRIPNFHQRYFSFLRSLFLRKNSLAKSTGKLIACFGAYSILAAGWICYFTWSVPAWIRSRVIPGWATETHVLAEKFHLLMMNGDVSALWPMTGALLSLVVLIFPIGLAIIWIGRLFRAAVKFW